ncbi:MAG: hypothetical protein DRJ15_17440 [Bacteroidetes bacterium]|nr:MAG: hypothetical protein DRJ15_17440 [Bacteroidota bacterium]
MPKTEFLKDQVLVAKVMDPRTRKPAMAQVVFVEYLPVPKIVGPVTLDCIVKDARGTPTHAVSDDLANILHAEAVMQAHQSRARGFGF